MKCSNEVIFKGIEERASGVFKNDKGQEISYPKAYVVRFDEEVEGDYQERKVKFSGDNAGLYTRFKTLKAYDRINLIFDIVLSNNSCKATIADFTQVAKRS
ncbi:MAG: hypothetical protein HFJ30_08485 [Clostridia bacterium]|jgi:hypothetical protein|nr:hypothetical protein [Clostridia bacterium]